MKKDYYNLSQQDKASEQSVKDANRKFYDIVADVYEKIDGRRTDEVLNWISQTLKDLSSITSGEVLLDFGCGTGVIINCGKKYFKKIYGMDISPEILKISKNTGAEVFCGDGSDIPLDDNSVDVVVCFAVLHHIFDPKPVLDEIFRILKSGGILYTDHDIDKKFADRFKMPLGIYRAIFDASKKYMRVKKEINTQMYKLSEVHSDGVDSDDIVEKLKSTGFIKIKSQYHWFGLNKITNILFKHKKFAIGWAPLFSVTAQK